MHLFFTGYKRLRNYLGQKPNSVTFDGMHDVNWDRDQIKIYNFNQRAEAAE